MKWLWQNRSIVEEENKGGDGGGGSSFLTPPAGGGTAPITPGNPSTPSGAAAGQPPGNPNPNPGAQGDPTADWKHTLPKELQGDASIGKFKDVSTLAGAYVNLQKLMGKDKMPVPGDHYSDEQWAEHYKKSGLPETVDKYDLKAQEGISLDKAFLDEFKSNAHKAGILPRQAQKLMDWFSEANKNSENMIVAERDRIFNESQAKLKQEWGNAYNTKVSRTIKLIQDHGGEELMKHFNASGVGGDDKFIKFAASIADKLYSEHKIIDGENGGSIRTPKEIQGEIDSIMGNKTHPLYVKDHPGHAGAVAQMQNLYKELYPPVDKK